MNTSASEILTLPPKRFSETAMETRVIVKRNEMRVAHVLRKYNPAEWGGTETAIQRLFTGLRKHGVESVVFSPQIKNVFAADPLAESGCAVKRFRAFLPVAGISSAERQQQITIGGNLLSFDLPFALWHEPGISVITT